MIAKFLILTKALRKKKEFLSGAYYEVVRVNPIWLLVFLFYLVAMIFVAIKAFAKEYAFGMREFFDVYFGKEEIWVREKKETSHEN